MRKLKLFFYKWKKDYIFKTIVSSFISFNVTILFALYNGFLGIRLLSVWHGSICVFYLFLVIIRGMILFTEKNNLTRNYHDNKHFRRRIFIISLILLLVLNFLLIFPISLMVVLEKPVSIGIIPAISMAAYTTYKMTMASVHIFKQKQTNKSNVLMIELRTINFIDALVSVLTLQNTLIMVNQSKSSPKGMLILSAISSGAIYIFIIIMTIHLVVIGINQSKNRLF